MDSVAGLEPAKMAPTPTARAKVAAAAAACVHFLQARSKITDTGTRFVPFTDVGQLVGAFVGGAVIGALIFTRRRK
jgi:hypothetical protein